MFLSGAPTAVVRLLGLEMHLLLYMVNTLNKNHTLLVRDM